MQSRPLQSESDFNAREEEELELAIALSLSTIEVDQQVSNSHICDGAITLPLIRNKGLIVLKTKHTAFEKHLFVLMSIDDSAMIDTDKRTKILPTHSCMLC